MINLFKIICHCNYWHALRIGTVCMYVPCVHACYVCACVDWWWTIEHSKGGHKLVICQSNIMNSPVCINAHIHTQAHKHIHTHTSTHTHLPMFACVTHIAGLMCMIISAQYQSYIIVHWLHSLAIWITLCYPSVWLIVYLLYNYMFFVDY